MTKERCSNKCNKIIISFAFILAIMGGCVDMNSRYEQMIVEDIDTVQVYNTTYNQNEDRYDLWYDNNNKKIRVHKEYQVGDTIEFWYIFKKE